MSGLLESQTTTDLLSAATVTPYAEVRETHSAVVFLVGDRGYKLKKPVDLGFLDFSTREKRLDVCRREVALNRRLAPDVYLGVSDITDVENHLMDHLVVMRRMPADRRLASLIRDGVDVHDEVRHIAHVVAAFHTLCARSANISAEGSRAAVTQRWEANFAESQRFVGPVLDPQRVSEVERLARRFLAGRDALFADRIERGAIVDGHGDLLAEDIFCLDDGPRILDCIEFDDRLRHLDRIDDIACLAMDLEHLGAADEGRCLVETYLELSGDNATQSLVHHYVAYRAFMRAKVTCLRWAQRGEGAAEARRLVDLAHRHLTDGQVRLILVGGGPGSGKSTLAAGVADQLGYTVLSSDRIRKELAGVAAESSQAAAYGDGIYTAAWTERTYAEMLRRAETLVGLGESVVLDATWSSARWRGEAARLAERTTTDLVGLQCLVPGPVADARVAGRAGVSDADPLIAGAIRAEFDDWPEAVTVDTAQPVAGSIRAALDAVRPGPGPGRVGRPRMPAD